ncbi:hypothetical protein AJ79_03966 [Helicocarpus griseus UAMH5409]|uniref:Chromatin assembly factor 1 subunit A n=1 Tax=Helicocarpus griseus UAMH5409 TaxID=1447875 RepID=A0A2B7XW26_9EURO|nr:hypothetical protein AJ79_03966 [Helicocarpus griseus UAMH5409]
MDAASQLGSTSPSSRKRSFSEVDGVRHTDVNGSGITVSETLSNDMSKDSSVTTTTSEIKSEIPRPSIETPDIPLSATATANAPTPTTTTIGTTSANPSAFISTDGSVDSSILTPIPLPNNFSQNQTSPPARSPSATGFTLPQNKKRKLFSASKQAKTQEKEAKERQRAEERVKKEEEKKKREEEKKKREEERKKKEEEKEEERKKREEKKKLKDEERLTREEEKRKRDEEKTKKERSQMRLNAFFAKPAAPNPATAGLPGGKTEESSKLENDSGGRSETAKTEKKPPSDYEQAFPPFFLQSHVKLAPPHRFERDAKSLKHAQDNLDTILQKSGSSESEGEQAAVKFCPSELFDMLPYKRRQGKPNGPTVKEILIKMQDTPSNPVIALTADENCQSPVNLLKKIPMKVLHFNEDVRPPYQGTFTKRLSEQEAKRLCRNPSGRMIPDANYDYDSEAEWEEPEEGEDLDSEGEEEPSEDGDGEMEDFLDDGDDDAASGKRRIIVGDLEPVCSGLRWEGEGKIDPAFESCRMEVISETLNFPIDPFSSSYWSKPPPANRAPLKHLTHLTNQSAERSASANSSKKQISQVSGFLQPFSLATSATTKVSQQGQSTASVRKPKPPFPPENVAEFREVIAGSNLTKAGLIEVLKKRFPKVSKDIIKDTLNSNAQRRGTKEADKKWVLI